MPAATTATRSSHAGSISRSDGTQGCVAISKKKPPIDGGFKCIRPRVELLQLRRDGIELGIEVGADRVDGGDDHDRNAGGDQAVFDGGGPRLIFQKRKNLRHVTGSCGSIREPDTTVVLKGVFEHSRSVEFNLN